MIKQMSKEVLKALQESIEHWKENVKAARKGEPLKIYSDDCPLCILRDKKGKTCGKMCPIAKRVGADEFSRNGCSETPWHNVALTYDMNPNRAELVKACKEELRFLRSLLPKKRRKR